jgi:tRNA threonylcarbamoyladenosine biosynthesis protein TsaB
VKLLAIETASDACSCALLVDGDCFERYRVAPRQHAELVLSMVQELLDEARLELANLDALAFGRGPGSFTGLRVAAGVIQGLAYGADLPVVPVSSLQALAQGARRESGSARVLAAFDARMGEVYWGVYEDHGRGLMTACMDDLAVAPEAVPLPRGGGWLGAGQGWGAYSRVLAERIGEKLSGTEPDRLTRAVDVATLARAAHGRGESVSAARALPVYVRNTVARKRGQ